MPFRPQNTRNWHYDFQIKGRRFYGSCGTEDFEEAKAVEAEARVRAKAAPDMRGLFTVAEAIGTYWTEISQHQSSSRTTLSQGKAIVSALPPTTLLADLTDADVIGYVSRRRAIVANATVNRELQMLGRAMRHMEKYHGAKVPKLELKDAQVKEPKERIRELSWDEQGRLFKHLRSDLHPLVKFALMTGARKGTITGLLWRDIDLANARIHFRMKGGEVMFFPVNREMTAFLSALPRADDAESKPYVLTCVNQLTKARHRIVPNGGSVDEDFRQALADAGIPDFRFHDLRHTFATRMLRRTGNLKLVSRLLGHADIETTMRYAHVLDGDLHDAMADVSSLKAPQSRRKSRKAS